MSGTLYIVATPIGNLKDVTLRALETLKEVDAIYCEDTRVTSKLLARYQIKKSLFRLDAVTERKKALEVISRLEKGEKIALVSDAGTPGGLSDPGAHLVSTVRKELPDAKIHPIPGASSVVAAFSVSGIESDGFTFAGFLPHKKGRQKTLDRLLKSELPIILFESPHRMEKLLRELCLRAPDRHVVICRELTKLYEEIAVGPVSEVEARFRNGAISGKGEFVVILAP